MRLPLDETTGVASSGVRPAVSPIQSSAYQVEDLARVQVDNPPVARAH